jgi:hypothetical protein
MVATHTNSSLTTNLVGWRRSWQLSSWWRLPERSEDYSTSLWCRTGNHNCTRFLCHPIVWWGRHLQKKRARGWFEITCRLLKIFRTISNILENDLKHVSNVNIVLKFADNTNFLVYQNKLTYVRLSVEYDAIKLWAKRNELIINVSKTKEIIFRSASTSSDWK